MLILARLVAVALIVLVVGPPSLRVDAQDAASSDWQPLSLQAGVVRLFTPRSGAFFAQAQTALYRSDDAGASWQIVPLPPLGAVPNLNAADQRGTSEIAVDPGNHQTIYAAAMDGLDKTTDAGRSWQVARPSAARVAAVAVSPADSRLVYVVQSNGQLARTTDAGQTWQDLPGQTFPTAGRGGIYGCGLTTLLVPNPWAANRLLLAIGCHAGRDEGQASSGNIDQSFDQGSTRVAFLRPDWSPAHPGFLVGAETGAPTRFYLTTDSPSRTYAIRVLSSRLFRTDDDGASWSELTGVWDDPGDESFVLIGGLVEDRVNADTVYVGLNQIRRMPGQGYERRRSWVRSSTDGGDSWVDVGCADLGGITDLALGIDGQNLYAATQSGVWGLALAGGATPAVPCDALAAAA